MLKEAGCCGSLYRILLAVVNLTTFTIGVIFIFLGALFKWTSFLDDVMNEVTDLVSDIGNAMDILFILFIGFGAIIVFISCLGLIGSCCGSRLFLVIYIFILSLIFLAYAILFFIGVSMMSQAEKSLKEAIDTQINKLIKSFPEIPTKAANLDDIEEECKIYRIAAVYLECCDFNTSYPLLIEKCCPSRFDGSCPDVLVDFLKVQVVLIPNSIALGVQLFIITAAIFLLVKIWKFNNKRKQDQVELKKYKRHFRLDSET